MPVEHTLGHVHALGNGLGGYVAGVVYSGKLNHTFNSQGSMALSRQILWMACQNTPPLKIVIDYYLIATNKIHKIY